MSDHSAPDSQRQREHFLKCWPSPFQAMRAHVKKLEFRLNDRDFQLGDILRLNEYDPNRNEYTGEADRYRVTHILVGPDFGVPAGYVAMSVEPIASTRASEQAKVAGLLEALEEISAPCGFNACEEAHMRRDIALAAIKMYRSTEER